MSTARRYARGGVSSCTATEDERDARRLTRLYGHLSGQNVTDFVKEKKNDFRELRLLPRYFFTFGLVAGFLRRMYAYPIVAATRGTDAPATREIIPDPPSAEKLELEGLPALCDGTRHMDALPDPATYCRVAPSKAGEAVRQRQGKQFAQVPRQCSRPIQ